MRIGQQVVSGGNKYSFPMPNANNNLVIFDIHNDSPYNVGVSLGVDTGINNCDYYTSPHGAIFGISPFGANRRTIGGSRWNGTIFVYTETPAGAGGTTNLASAPASSVTVLGYPQGYQPQNQIALNRMQTTANTVQTAGNLSATSVANDNNAGGTSVVEATVVGSPGSNVAIANDGTVTIADWTSLTRHVLFQIFTGQTNPNPSVVACLAGQLMEILGNLYIGQNLHLNNRSLLSINDASGANATVMTVDGVGNTVIQNHSTNDGTVIWDKSGNVIATFSGPNKNVAFQQGSLKRIVKFTGTSIVGKVSVNPNMTDTPDLVLVNYNVTSTPSAATIAPNYATLSATNIDIWASLAAPFVGVAIKF